MILITGSAGFIGFHLAKYYLKKNIRVIGIDNYSDYYDIKFKKNRTNILKLNKKFTFLKVDLSNKKSFEKLNKYKNKINFIFHLAGQAGVRYSFKNPASYIKNNIEAYIYLLEYFKYQKNIKAILYASSSSIYGDNVENEKNKMISVYAVSKKALEQISSVYNHNYNLNFVGMRFFTVYGPYGRPDMAVYKFFDRITKNQKIEIYNYGNHSRSYTYITDVVENINKIIIFIKKKEHKKSLNKILNIGNPKTVNLNNFIKLIEKYSKKKAKIKYLPKQTGDVLITKAKINNEEKNFKFRFNINIEKGLKKFSHWFLNEK